MNFHIDINSQAPNRTSTSISLDLNQYFLQFALLTEKIMISSIIRNFHLHALRKTNDIPVIPEIITRPQGGITLVLKPRKAIDSSRISQIPIDKRGWKFWTVDNKFQNTNFRFRNYRLFIIIFLLGMDRCKKSKSVLPRYDKAVIRYPIWQIWQAWDCFRQIM